ncbi:DUF2971 domain-containing protein [Rhodobacteraceae bacterium NNCM2]|nr:DUF2971 domain-containing protein [Coraliihabitans acroporae]
MAAGRDSEERLVASDLREELFSEHGVISFSKTWKEPLLWSHYADNHRGLALGFDLKPRIGFEVKYTTARLILPSADEEKYIFGERIAFWDAIKRTKFKPWSYEKEVRMFPSIEGSINENGMLFRPFSHIGDLKEVVIGASYQAVKNSQLERQLRDRGVDFTTARLGFEDFSVTSEPDEKLHRCL